MEDECNDFFKYLVINQSIVMRELKDLSLNSRLSFNSQFLRYFILDHDLMV